MKKIIGSILLISVFITGYCSTKNYIPVTSYPAKTQAESLMDIYQLKILDSITDVTPGNVGYITIKGKPKTKYSIKTSFRKGTKTFYVTQWRTTDNYGIATFNWIVSSDTNPGTYLATISGEGESIVINHVVIKLDKK